MGLQTNINQFLKETKRELEEEQQKIESKGKEIVLEAYRGIVNKSPVDTGLFRSSNLITLNATTSETPSDVDNSRNLKEQSIINGLRFNNNDRIFIQSNLVYAEKLESGHSKQATAGIYGVTEVEIRRFLNQRIK